MLRQTQEVAVGVNLASAQGELRNIQFYKPIEGIWVSTAPTFPYNLLCGLKCYGINLSGTVKKLTMRFTIFDPNGVSLGTRRYDHPNTASGEGFTDYNREICLIPGDYVGVCKLYLDDELVASVSEVCCHATGEPIDALISQLWRWDAEGNEWVANAPQFVPLNSAIGMRVQARNICYNQIDVRADLRYTSEESGATRTLKGNVITIDPGDPPDYAYWDFLWEADALYEWVADVILYAGYPGQSLSEIDRISNLPVAWVIPGELPPPPPPEGHLFAPYIRDASTQEILAREMDFPADIPLGTRVVGDIDAMNDADGIGIFTLMIELIDPDGVSRGKKTGDATIASGGIYGLYSSAITLDKQGTWKLHAVLKGETAEGDLVLLDEETWNAIAVSVAGYRGTITTKEFEFSDWTRVSIPFSDIPLGKKGGVLIGGTNNMGTTQQMGISWKVKDPDGVVVDSYETWEWWPYTGPGAEHMFAEPAGQFNLDKVGTYTIKVELLMNHEAPVIVDTYDGTLCTVTTEVPPEYELIKHHEYHWAFVYEGKAETAIIILRFPPEQITPPEWVGDKLVKAWANELKKEGRKLLEIKVYADTTPLFWTDFRLEVTASVPEGETSMAVGGPGWQFVAVAVLIILGLILLAWVIKEIVEIIFHPKAGFEDYKAKLSRETVISVTNDFEEDLGRDITPVEELEAMPEDELREYCDSLAKEAVPPPKPSIWPWIAAGVVGTVAVVAVAKYATKK